MRLFCGRFDEILKHSDKRDRDHYMRNHNRTFSRAFLLAAKLVEKFCSSVKRFLLFSTIH